MDTPAAADQTDRLILEIARTELGPLGGGDLVILDDATGALTDAALAAIAGTLAEEGTASASAEGGPAVLVQEASSQRALALAEAHPSARREGRLVIAGIDGAPEDLASLLEGRRPQLALARLPKALAALESRAAGLARAGVPALVAGARVKHMTRTQNEVLARAYEDVHATRGLGKSRALVARSPRGNAPAPQERADTTELDVCGTPEQISLHAVGGVFGGSAPDAGSLLLLGALDQALVAGGAAGLGIEAPDPENLDVVDLGSGNGLMGAYLRRALPSARLLATDDDLDAVLSTRATLSALGAGAEAGFGAGTGDGAGPGTGSIRVLWEASLAAQAADSADLVLLNPPFHDGTAVDATLVHGMLDAVARVLRPGGRLWFVHNSHLRYRTEVEKRVGPVRQRARDRRFTVLEAVRS